jgi:DNA polymerase IIIc chi subunit
MTKEEITKEILELKSKKVITTKDKLRIQLLQQELWRFDNEK